MQRPELWRTTTFRLTLVYGAVFAAGVVALLGLIYASAAVYLTRQMDEIVLGEARGLQTGPAAAMPQRVRDAETQDIRNVNFYGLFKRNGSWIAGNVRRLPIDVPLNGVPLQLREPGFQPGARALAERLPSGEILFVGFDAKVLTGLRSIIMVSLIWSGALIIVLGLGLGAALSLAPLRRIRAVQQASLPILEGDVSARLPTSNRHDEIDMLAAIANGMMDEVERLLWAVKSVGDNVAHDLRTPLTRLRALLYRVRQESGGSLHDNQMLDQALGETDALLGRFKAIQRISEVDRRERRAGFAPVRLKSLVEEIGELYEPLAEDRRLTLVTEAEAACEILADRELLFEAFSNLVGNAIKFTPPGGAVRLALSKQAEGPRLEIIDSGPGVPEDERDAVLQRFYRGRRDRDVPGSGLGLSIVAAVARLHDFRMVLGDASPGLRVTLDCWPTAMRY
ncbi:MAG TPA: HAMP domain-containing sensor histidine kinase [Caulobacteraceae bacterium]|jgi:signal transduction histidine kinase